MTAKDPARPEASRDDANEDASTNRERILETAITEFANVGFAATSMNRIAELSGLNKQLIYHYFGNKRGLYAEVMSRMLSATLSDESITGLDEIMLRGRELTRRETWFRLLGWEGLQEDPTDVPYAERRRGAFGRLEQTIRDLQANDVVDPDADAQIVALLWALATIAPHVLPQVTQVITGQHPEDEGFDARLEKTLRIILGGGSVQP